MSEPDPPRRRSCLAVPGSSAKMLAKAPALPADELIVDLEDAVLPAAKDDARRMVVEALASDEWAGCAVSVRVNAPRTPWCHRDIAALAAAEVPPQALVVPKVEDPGDLAFVDRLLDGVEASAGASTGTVRLQALIESASGLSRVGRIACSSPRLESLILGYADLAASLGRSSAALADLDSWRFAQDSLLTACRSTGLQAIDGPYLLVAVDEDFAAAVARAADLGFDGKWAIHPAQLARVNEAFTPTAGEIERAQAVLDALARAERSRGQGAVALDGAMLDEALAISARRTLARAAKGSVAAHSDGSPADGG